MTTKRLDIVLYGTALALALIGGVLAVAKGLGGGAEPQLLEPPGEPAADRAPVAPRLPAVPDLRAQPPPAAPAHDDPRVAELGVEMRYLSRARALLAEQPAQAFDILEQHRERHPAGALREEREAYAIEALVGLGRTTQAERRYYDFVREYPASSFRARLAALLR